MILRNRRCPGQTSKHVGCRPGSESAQLENLELELSTRWLSKSSCSARRRGYMSSCTEAPRGSTHRLSEPGLEPRPPLPGAFSTSPASPRDSRLHLLNSESADPVVSAQTTCFKSTLPSKPLTHLKITSHPIIFSEGLVAGQPIISLTRTTHPKYRTVLGRTIAGI